MASWRTRWQAQADRQPAFGRQHMALRCCATRRLWEDLSASRALQSLVTGEQQQASSCLWLLEKEGRFYGLLSNSLTRAACKAPGLVEQAGGAAFLHLLRLAMGLLEVRSASPHHGKSFQQLLHSDAFQDS